MIGGRVTEIKVLKNAVEITVVDEDWRAQGTVQRTMDSEAIQVNDFFWWLHDVAFWTRQDYSIQGRRLKIKRPFADLEK